MATLPNKGDFPRNRPLNTRYRVLLASTGVASYLLFLVLRWFPWLTENVYGNYVGPFMSMVLSTVAGIIPIAVGELLVVAILLSYAVRLLVSAGDVLRRRRQARNVFAVGSLRLAGDIGVFVTLFYLLWGFNYALPPLQDRLGWEPLGDVDEGELFALAVETVVATNAAYLDVHGVPDAGAPTVLHGDVGALERALEEGWKNARQELRLPAFADRFGRPKTPLFTGFYEWLGVAGFYFPFTGEANVRAGIPAIDYPQMLAHELTHQRGVTRESEANFWGYLAAVRSPDPLARYSAFRLANRQMVVELARVNPQRALILTQRRLPGVQRDIEDSRNYWLQFRGPGTTIGRSVNDAFLRSNRVEGGVRSYSMSAILFVAYARANGGSLLQTPTG